MYEFLLNFVEYRRSCLKKIEILDGMVKTDAFFNLEERWNDILELLKIQWEQKVIKSEPRIILGSITSQNRYLYFF